MKKMMYVFLSSIFLLSCGEELATQVNKPEVFRAQDIETFSYDTCASAHLVKPKVDILYIVDNSGSTLMSSFEAIKSQIVASVSNISNDFNYRAYVAPLNSIGNDQNEIKSYPVMANYPYEAPALTAVGLIQPSSLNASSFFSGATGNNVEYGFSRAYNVVQANRSNGIFRNQSNLIIVMISNGDDNEAMMTIGGNQVRDQNVFNAKKNQLLSFSKQYSDSHSVASPLQAQSLRFLSLVAHSNCNGFKAGANYKQMSSDIYTYMQYNDDNSYKNSYNLCGSNYAQVFASVNKSIQAQINGHKYDHAKISNQSEQSIQSDDITVYKISNGVKTVIPESATNGFEYLGYQSGINTRYATQYTDPDPGEPVTGLVVKLNGSARFEYPECVIAKTRTPTEYFGYIGLAQDPDLATVVVKVNGQTIPKNNTNGWSYHGYHEVLNIKVPGPTSAPITPAKNESGYFLKLNGSSIITNGDQVNVNYKAKL